MAMSFKRKLILMVVSLVLLTQVAALVQYVFSTNAQRNDIKKSFEEYANTLNSAISAQFYERYGDVQAFAINEIFQTTRTEDMVRMLDMYTNLYGIYDLILFVDAKGNYVASNSKDAAGSALNVSALKEKNYTEEVWFKNAVSRAFTEDKVKGFTGTYVEAPAYDSLIKIASGKKTFANGFSAPVYDSKGNVIGAITNRANFKWAENEVLNVYNTMKVNGLQHANIVVLDYKGQIIIDLNPVATGKVEVNHDENILTKFNLLEKGHLGAVAMIKDNFEGVMDTVNLRTQKNELAAINRFENPKFLTKALGWGIMVRDQKDDLYASLDHAIYIYLTSMFVTMFISAGAGIYLAQKTSHSLYEITSAITKSAIQVKQSSEMVADVSQSISSSSVEIASSIEQSVASIEEFSSMGKRNLESAQTASVLSSECDSQAKTGATEISTLVETIQQIEASSKRMSEIISAIDDIAFQTNLLALNAAVEAARAGEQGKGFAVVADAVRSLAQRSTVSAQEIKTLINNNESVAKQGVHRVSSASSTIEVIKNSVNKITNINNEISESTNEQTVGLNHINKAMNELDQASQNNAASSEKLASSAEELKSQADNLEQAIENLTRLIEGADADLGPVKKRVA